MKQALRIGVGMLVIAVVQNTLTSLWQPLGLFDGLMILAGLLAFRLRFAPAVLGGAAAGLIQDSLAGGLIGLHAFAKTAVTSLLSSLGGVLMVRGQLAEALLIGGAAVLEAAVARLLLLFLGWPGAEPVTTVLARGVATGLLCGAFLLGWPWVVTKWQRRRQRPRISLS